QCIPHPTLLKITEESLIAEKKLIPGSYSKPWLSQKPSSPFQISYSPHHSLYFNFKKSIPLNKTQNIIFIDIELIASNYTKGYHPDDADADILSHPKISSKIYNAITNKYFLWKVLFRFSKNVCEYIRDLCEKHSAKIILYSNCSELTLLPQEKKLIFSLTPLSDYIVDHISHSTTKRLHINLESRLIQEGPHLRSFIFLIEEEKEFFKERSLCFEPQSIDKYFKQANRLLSTPLAFENSSLENYWHAFKKGHLSLIAFDLNQLNYLKIGLGITNENLQAQIFKCLPLNKKIKKLTLNYFTQEDFLPQLTLALENIPFLESLCLSNNNLVSFNALLHFLDGKTHHTAELDLSHNPVAVDQQIILATWIKSYPMPIKIHFNTSQEFDSSILKAIYYNHNIQFFSNTLFQSIHTTITEAEEIIEELKHENRFIYPDKHKYSCIIS
ncbi:MAG: hypothetical protein JO131_02890, partial [Gammaproteobacteria bacterium]|nr:hypothetical protein [Gammaproteobacteria bacterium]